MGLVCTAAAVALLAGCGTIRSAREAQRRVEHAQSVRESKAVDLNGMNLSDLVAFALTNRPAMTSAALAVKDSRLAMKQLESDAPIASTTPWNAFGVDVSGGYAESSPAKHFDNFEFKTEKSRATAGLSFMSLPCTARPMPCSTSASGLIDTPPMPARWARRPGTR